VSDPRRFNRAESASLDHSVDTVYIAEAVASWKPEKVKHKPQNHSVARAPFIEEGSGGTRSEKPGQPPPSRNGPEKPGQPVSCGMKGLGLVEAKERKV